MTVREPSDHIDATSLTTGLFHQTSGYSAWRPHGTRDWLLIYTVGGKGRFGYGSGEILAEPGDWVLLRPGTLHDYGVEASLKNWNLLWAHVLPREHWLPLLGWPVVNPGLMRVTLADKTIAGRAFNRFLEAHQLATGPLRGRELLAMNALEEVLLWCDQSNAQSGPRVDPRIAEAMDYLIQHLHEKPTIPETADKVGLSVSRLAHLFKSETGITPQRFLEARRIDRAAQLLQRTNFSIKQIAQAVGFDSPFYFSLRFKAMMKRSPKSYRQAQRTD